MAKKSNSPTEADIQRIAESIKNLDTFNKIKTYDDFEKAFEDYLEDTDLVDNKSFKSDVFDTYSSRYEVNDTRSEQERTVSQKRIKERQESLSSRTIQQQNIPITLKAKSKRELNYNATEKGGNRVVFASKETVNNQGRQQVRYRDGSGRFASVKK